MEENVCLSQEAEPPGQHAGMTGLALDELIQNTLPSSHVAPATTGITSRVFIMPSRGASTCKPSPRSQAFRKQYFPEATAAEWNDWRWQVRNRITGVEMLSRILWLSAEEEMAIHLRGEAIPLNITPYYASLLDPMDADQPMRRMVVPVMAEFDRARDESDDPLAEDHDTPVPGLVHRYPDRVLFLVTGFCSTHCRYCTRSRMVGRHEEIHADRERWSVRLPTSRTHRRCGHPAFRRDPLTLPDETLDWLLSRLRAIPHVELIRIGTKVPVVLPQRVTASLCHVLKRHHPLWMSIHFAHPEELTFEVSQACNRLADAGIPLGSQTVLLAGVNDNVETMKRLVHDLVMNRVRPYYLYQCDPITGSSHFRTPVSRGLEIIEGLRGHTTGYAVPTYVIDAPGGGGKIPLLPGYVVGHDENHILLRNYQGRTFQYPDPAATAECEGRV
jgi:lysine 2,3-aminomutase